MGGPRWTAEERELVRELYPLHGAAWDGWAELLAWPRKPPAIRSMARELGVQASREAQVANMRAARERSGYGRQRKRKPKPRWTDEQRMVVARHLRDMCRETGRTLNECAMEWNRMIDEWRDA